MKFLTNIDLQKNELQNAVIQVLATAPASGQMGQIYYNSVNKGLYQHNGTAWVLVGSTYTQSYGSLANNTVPLTLTGNDGSTSTVNIKGAGGATLSVSGNTLTITTANDNTTYTYTGAASASAYTVTIAPSSGQNQTVTIGLADGTNAGLMSPADYTKLSGIASGAEVNQNAFSNVKVGSTTIAADAKTDTLELAAGNNVTLTPDSTNDKVTIAATDTTYGSGTQSDLETGTSTTDKVWQPKLLHDYIGSVAGATDAMRFKGTIGTGGDITSLPTSGVKVGDTYRVITAGTYAGQTCEIGDLIIATSTTPTWTVAQTNIDGAITSISGTAPISVSGSGASRTVAISDATQSVAGAMSAADKVKLDGIAAGAQVNPTYTAFTGKPTGNQTPSFGGTFTISQISQATNGQVSGTDRTVTIPNTAASASDSGLMTSAMFNKLNNMPSFLSGTATITAGQTSATATLTSLSKLWGVTAVDASNGNAVMIDTSANFATNKIDFTISQAYAENISIMFLYEG